jgi:hypothetical protein
MINTVTFAEEPTLFEERSEFAIDSIQDHRRGSGFWREDIIELKAEHKEYFPEVKDFEQYLGTWKTNQVLWDSVYGFEETFSELYRVEKEEIIFYEWINL